MHLAARPLVVRGYAPRTQDGGAFGYAPVVVRGYAPRTQDGVHLATRLWLCAATRLWLCAATRLWLCAATRCAPKLVL